MQVREHVLVLFSAFNGIILRNQRKYHYLHLALVWMYLIYILHGFLMGKSLSEEDLIVLFFTHDFSLSVLDFTLEY
jgi:hypothetical protein